MKINEIIVRLEDWQQRNGYSIKQGQLTEIIKDLREEAKVLSSNAVLADSLPHDAICTCAVKDRIEIKEYHIACGKRIIRR